MITISIVACVLVYVLTGLASIYVCARWFDMPAYVVPAVMFIWPVILPVVCLYVLGALVFDMAAKARDEDSAGDQSQDN